MTQGIQSGVTTTVGRCLLGRNRTAATVVSRHEMPVEEPDTMTYKVEKTRLVVNSLVFLIITSQHNNNHNHNHTHNQQYLTSTSQVPTHT